MNEKKLADKDLQFLKDIKENLIKWRDGNDWVARDYAFNMIDDWIDELKSKIKR